MMDLKSAVLWILAAINALAILIDNIVKIRTGASLLKSYRAPIIGAALFLAGGGAGVFWERRIVNEKQDYLNQVQTSEYNLEQKYESLVEASSCKKNAPQILLYEDARYGGRKLCFTTGYYDDLRDFAFNDVTSSIRLAGNLKLVVYEDIHFGGRMLIVEHDYDSLSPDWNDKISSLKVCSKQDQCN
jgi:hypothetical protein